jgi:hypothetical protein
VRHCLKILLVVITCVISGVVCGQTPQTSRSQILSNHERRVRPLRMLSQADQDTFGKLPLSFEPNAGQMDRRVKFVARAPGQTLFLTGAEAILCMEAPAGSTQSRKKSVASVFKIRFVGADHHAIISAEDPLSGKVNYFLGSDPEHWRTNISSYGKIRYSSLYPGIDLVYHGKQGLVEYDFVVAPGRDPSKIRFDVHGAVRLELDASGRLRVRQGTKMFQSEPPVIYQEVAGARQLVRGGYTLQGRHRVGFWLGAYNPSLPLVIDPVLTYATYLGGNNSAQANGIAVDSSGNIYLTGTTRATNFPVVTPFQNNLRGTQNVFVTKINPQGNAILYSTYLGGSFYDYGTGIAVDSAGNAYVSGTTGSRDFPTTPGAFLRTCPGICNTPFVAKFLSDGTLGYSTYTGGSNTVGNAIAVDASGSAYITGITASADLPVVNAFQPTFSNIVSTSTRDAFVQKLSADGSALIYSTYLGTGQGLPGGGVTHGRAIAVDSSGSAYVVGNSSSIPVQNAIQPAGSAFVTKFNPAGNTLAYSTFLSGSASDEVDGVAVDNTGAAYITGTTQSADFPLDLNAFRTAFITQKDFRGCSSNGLCLPQVFVSKLAPDGSSIIYSTLLGPGSAGGIATDANGNSIVTGSVGADFPVVDPFQSSFQPGQFTQDAFVSRLDSAGNVTSSSYLGGFADDRGMGVALDSNGNGYVAGLTNGLFPLINSLQPESCCSGARAFIAKVSTQSQPQISLTPLQVPLLTLRNVSDAPLALYNITTSSDLTQTNNCGTGLLPGGSCFLALEGSSNIPSTGTVTITSNAPVSPQVFTVNKVFHLPFSNLVESATSLAFPVQLIGTSSAPKPIVLTNLSSSPSTISVMARPDFSETDNCSVLQPLSSCTVNVTYTPSSPVSPGTYLQITHDSISDFIYLYSAGSTSALDLSATSLNFVTQYAGAASASRVVTVTNVSSEAATVTGISVTGNFAETDTCTQPLLPGASCRIAVRFTPDGNGWRTGTLTIANLGPGGTQTVNLYGRGQIASDLAVSPLELDLFPIQVGQTGDAPTLTLTNTSNAPISISQFTLPAGSSETDTCNSPLAPHASCTVNVTFTPPTVGDYTGNLVITHSGAGSPQIVPFVGGSGVTALYFSPASGLVFGDQPVGTASGQKPLFIGNNSNSSVNISGVNITGDFAIAQNPCPATLPAFNGCALQIIFQPAATGIRNGSITISASDSASPHVLPLQGRGVGAGAVSLQPASLTFGQQHIGTSSSSQAVTLTNTGAGPLNIGGISASTQFLETDNCTNPIQPGLSCQINISFAPAISGILTGSLSIQDDAPGGPHTVHLQGTAFDKLITTVFLSSSAPVSSVGQTATFTAVVSARSGVPTGSVDFYSGPSKIGSAALNGGAAQFVDSSLAAGAYSITAVYTGDANNFNSTATALLQVVTRVSSTIQLGSSANPSTAGNSVTFTASVLPLTGPGASGPVQFYDGNSLLTTATAVNGVATFNTSGLSSGVHAIRTVYGGDASYSGSRSNLFQIVNQQGVTATHLVLTLVITPPNAGVVPGVLLSRQGLSFSIDVSSNVGGSFTGNIFVIDGDTMIQSVLIGGSGHTTFVLPSLTVGPHNLKVAYTGDNNFGGAISDSVSIQRSPKPH